MSATSTDSLSAPRLQFGPTSKWRSEFEAFERMLPNLLSAYRDQYVVIHNGMVVDSGSNDVAWRYASLKLTATCPCTSGLVTDKPQTPNANPALSRARSAHSKV